MPSLEIDGQLYTAWEEGIEREVDFEMALSADGSTLTSVMVPFEFARRFDQEELRDHEGKLAGRVVREQEAIRGALLIEYESIPGPYSLVKVRLREENLTPWTVARGRA